MAYKIIENHSNTALENMISSRAQADMGDIAGQPNANVAVEEQYKPSGKVNIGSSTTPSYKNKSLKSLGILGIPYRFSGYADVPMGKLYNTSHGAEYIGRVYDQNILSNAPITFFEVGRPLFLDGLNKKQELREDVINKLNGITDTIEDALFGKKDSKYSANQLHYYGFEDDFLTYAAYVDAMVRFTAIKMGIGDRKSPDMANPYKGFKLTTMKNKLLTNSGSIFPNLIGSATGIGYLQGLIRDISQSIPTAFHVPMYCTASETSHAESIQTSMGESMLSSNAKGISQLGREISFILNGSDLGKFGDDAIKGITDGLNDIVGGLGDGAISGLLKQVTSGAATIASGSNMLFPSIWQDTTYTKSYNIGISLTTPYGDPTAIMNDIYLPLFCIIAMAMPRQTYATGYGAPFIVKAYSKGYFNCDMGMIESVEIRKGGNSNTEWTIHGFPTALDITISLKDLYPAIVATQKNASAFFFSGNTGLTQHLNLMAGVDLIAVDPLANLGAAAAMFSGSVDNIWEHSETVIRHQWYKNISYAVDHYFS